MALGAPVGSAIGALTADSWGRKPTIIGASISEGIGQGRITANLEGLVVEVPAEELPRRLGQASQGALFQGPEVLRHRPGQALRDDGRRGRA